jgi:leucyl aminopeptidase
MNNIEFNIHQKRRAPNRQELDAHPSWVILYSSSVPASSRKRFPYADILEKRRENESEDIHDTEPHITDLPNSKGTRIAYACIKPDIKAFDLLTLCRKLIAVFNNSKQCSLSVHVSGFTEKQKHRFIEAIVAAAYAASAKMPNFKSDKKDNKAFSEMTIYGALKPDGYKHTVAEGEGNALCRYLSMLPPNKLTPTEYVKILRPLCKENNWKMEFLDISALKRKKAGAFLAVVQGSSVQDAGIVCLRYNPKRISRMKKLALVGKGICYDTGGTNLKPAKYMYGMHEDMQGSAVALGVLLALTRLKVDFPVECWLALAMNHIGPKAYKPNDVVTASDGTTIEVVHTDAEGRMVLSDTLNFATQKKPSLLLDYATLTGACVYSLGTAYTGVFTNREKLIPELIHVGQECGERVWPFPMDEDYDAALKSKIADIKQCSLEGNADHILAARFLSRFVKHDTPWIHMDLASSSSKGGLAHIPTDTTGFGIRYTLKLLAGEKVWKA